MCGWHAGVVADVLAPAERDGVSETVPATDIGRLGRVGARCP